MLWPVGRVNPGITPQSSLVKNYTSLATLYKSARQGVDDAVAAGVEKPQVMIRTFFPCEKVPIFLISLARH